jgi:hypothetical protein
MRKALALALGLATIGRAETFWGVGCQILASTSPKPTGWAVTGTLIYSPRRIYSFSETDFEPVKDSTGSPRIQTSARTGFGTYVYSYRGLDLFALVNGGVATDGTNTGVAVAAGGLACYSLKADSPWYLAVGYRAIKTTVTGTTQLVSLGLLHRTKNTK